MKKIIVVGCGHGGLVVASKLASVGMDVLVFEKKNRDNLGYDWTDIFDIESFKEASLYLKNDLKMDSKEPMTFYSPNLENKIKPDDSLLQKEVKMERRDIYDILIDNALRNGVVIKFNYNIIDVIKKDDFVCGVRTFDEEFYADLVIDASGVNSNLKKKMVIDKKIGNYNNIYVYRAFYNKISLEAMDDKYRVYLMPDGKKGVSWVSYEDNYVDVLIGRFDNIDKDIVNKEVDRLRKYNNIGNEIVRGGDFTVIPVRRPMEQLVYNGYVLIGDSACMTIPLMGSGIALSVRAAIILSDVLIKNKNKQYDINNLWEYQVLFFRKYGYDLAFKDIFKNKLINMDTSDIDYLFSKGIISDKMIAGVTSGKDMSFNLGDIFLIIVKGIGNIKLLIDLAFTLFKGIKIKILCKKIPKSYNYNKVMKWVDKYRDII